MNVNQATDTAGVLITCYSKPICIRLIVLRPNCCTHGGSGWYMTAWAHASPYHERHLNWFSSHLRPTDRHNDNRLHLCTRCSRMTTTESASMLDKTSTLQTASKYINNWRHAVKMSTSIRHNRKPTTYFQSAWWSHDDKLARTAFCKAKICTVYL